MCKEAFLCSLTHEAPQLHPYPAVTQAGPHQAPGVSRLLPCLGVQARPRQANGSQAPSSLGAPVPRPSWGGPASSPGGLSGSCPLQPCILRVAGRGVGAGRPALRPLRKPSSRWPSPLAAVRYPHGASSPLLPAPAPQSSRLCSTSTLAALSHLFKAALWTILPHASCKAAAPP